MRHKLWILTAMLFAFVLAATVGLVMQPFVQPVVSQSSTVSAARLEAHVKHLSVDLYPRSHDRLGNLELAAQYIQTQFNASGTNVTTQEVRVQEITYKNVIARFGPAAGPLLVIGAHYDSHGNTAEGARHPRGYSSETHTPGADDNASGVAGLIELARLLHDNPPPRPVELVAYTLEEPPHFGTEHMGSAWHARSLAETQRPVRLMVSIEMIGTFSDEASSQDYPVPGMGLLYPDKGNFIALVGRLDDIGATRKAKSIMSGATDLPVFSINAPGFVQGVDFSDHRNYWSAEIPALMVTDTAFYRNRSYHQAGDTYDKLDYLRMAKVVQAVFAITRHY